MNEAVNDFASPQAFLEWFLSPSSMDEEEMRRRLREMPDDWWATIDGSAAEALYQQESRFPPRTVWQPHPDEHDQYSLIELKRRALADERQRRAYHP